MLLYGRLYSPAGITSRARSIAWSSQGLSRQAKDMLPSGIFPNESSLTSSIRTTEGSLVRQAVDHYAAWAGRPTVFYAMPDRARRNCPQQQTNNLLQAPRVGDHSDSEYAKIRQVLVKKDR